MTILCPSSYNLLRKSMNGIRSIASQITRLIKATAKVAQNGPFGAKIKA